jgi:hypothetical protein
MRDLDEIECFVRSRESEKLILLARQNWRAGGTAFHTTQTKTVELTGAALSPQATVRV